MVATLGKMRHRVLLQKPVEVTDAGGGRTYTWTNVETVWAEVRPISARETLYGMAVANPVTHRISMRHRSDILPGWRIVYDSREFKILSVVDPDERKHWLELTVEEGLPT